MPYGQPSAQFVRANPANVEYCERHTILLANLVPRGRLRSGTQRNLPSTPVARSVHRNDDSIPVLPAADPAPVSQDESTTRSSTPITWPATTPPASSTTTRERSPNSGSEYDFGEGTESISFSDGGSPFRQLTPLEDALDGEDALGVDEDALNGEGALGVGDEDSLFVADGRPNTVVVTDEDDAMGMQVVHPAITLASQPPALPPSTVAPSSTASLTWRRSLLPRPSAPPPWRVTPASSSSLQSFLRQPSLPQPWAPMPSLPQPWAPMPGIPSFQPPLPPLPPLMPSLPIPPPSLPPPWTLVPAGYAAFTPRPPPQVTTVPITQNRVPPSQQTPPSSRRRRDQTQLGNGSFIQTAPHPRLTALCGSNGLVTLPRPHGYQGYWYSMTAQQIADGARLQEGAQRDRWIRMVSIVGAIMETDAGIQRFGLHRCRRCITRNFECWVPNPDGAPLPHSTPTCARCRTMANRGGCRHDAPYGGGATIEKPGGLQKTPDGRRNDERDKQGGMGRSSGASILVS